VCDYENGGISVSVRGDFTITSLKIAKETLEEAANGKAERFHTMLTNVLNAAIKNVKKSTQEQMMKMMSGEGGLSGLFGK
jgi:DNA-binding protein YbaB